LNVSTERLFDCMTQPLGQVLGSGCDSELVTVALFQVEDASHWIVLARPARFIDQKLLNLALVPNDKGAVEIYKSARLTAARLFAGRTNCRVNRPPALVLPVICVRFNRPPTIGVKRATLFANAWFRHCSVRPMAAALVVHAFSKGFASKWFIAAHAIDSSRRRVP
jgi:hypothetical protein